MTDRRIVLLRHAKAERPDAGPDIERPLTARGRADALAAGAWLATRGLRPDVVICSPASRTRQTWRGVAETVAGDGGEVAVHYPPVVYGGSPARLLRLIRAVDPTTGTLLLIGHNPTISELSDLLDTSSESVAARSAGIATLGGYGMRTAGLVVHRVDVAWPDVEPASAPVQVRHTARG